MLNVPNTLSFKKKIVRFFLRVLCIHQEEQKSNQICFIQITDFRGADCHSIYSDELPKRKTGRGIIGICHTCWTHECFVSPTWTFYSF